MAWCSVHTRCPACFLGCLLVLISSPLTSQQQGQPTTGAGADLTGNQSLLPSQSQESLQQAGALISVDTRSLPHVSECNYCLNCHVTEPILPVHEVMAGQQPGRRALLQAQAQHMTSSWQAPSTINSQALLRSSGRFGPTTEEGLAKSLKKNCSECHGCSVKLVPLQNVTAFNHSLKMERGNSPQYVYLVDLPGSGGRRAVLKIWCIPLHKFKGHFTGWGCSNAKDGFGASAHLLAMQQVQEDCGLQDVTPHTWVAPVNAVLPENGFHVWWDGLWQEQAPGISMNMFAFMGGGRLPFSMQLEVIGERLNTTRVVQSAIVDLLTSQCDRHSQNILIDDSANIHLIDNLQALGWDFKCGFDSIFLVTSQKSEIMRLGGDVVFKKKDRPQPNRSKNPMLLFDYRCYVEGGQLGTNFAPQLAACLRNLSAMTVGELKQHYGFPKIASAKILQRRAQDMLQHGFEWTIKHGSPRNPPAKTYKFQPPCCKLEMQKGMLQCAHKWEPSTDMPLGNPVSGAPDWKGPGMDPGKFVGGKEY